MEGFEELMKETSRKKSRGQRIEEQRRELARALLKAGRSYREVAAALQMGVASVHRVAQEDPQDIEPLVREIKKRFSMKYYLLANHVLDSIDGSDIRNASLKEKALAAAILTDKAVGLDRLERVEHPSEAETA